MTNEINIKKALNDFKPSFKAGFDDRVMQQLHLAKENAYNSTFNKAFKRIFLSGAAAVVILLISIYLSDGGLSSDALLGTSEMDIESYTAMMFNNF